MMKTGDKLVLFLATIFVAGLYAVMWSSPDQADFAQITVDGKEQQLVSLAADRLIGTQGVSGVSELEINHGRIRFLHSPCPNQICVHTGWLQHGGEFAACLPNRVAIEIVGNKTLFDSINF